MYTNLLAGDFGTPTILEEGYPNMDKISDPSSIYSIEISKHRCREDVKPIHLDLDVKHRCRDDAIRQLSLAKHDPCIPINLAITAKLLSPTGQKLQLFCLAHKL